MKMNEMLDSQYHLNESDTSGDKVVYSQYATSHVASHVTSHTGVSQVRSVVGYTPDIFHGQVQTFPLYNNKVPILSFKREVDFHYTKLKNINNFVPWKESQKTLSDEIVIVQLRETSYDDAKIEIIEYIKDAGRKVYISEIAEKLRLDIEVIMQVMDELESD